MRRVKNVRKARFRAALAMTGHTQDSWAKQEKVSPSMLSQVLDGKRVNDALQAKVDAFTEKHSSVAA
jgi:hypothetical protein